MWNQIISSNFNVRVNSWYDLTEVSYLMIVNFILKLDYFHMIQLDEYKKTILVYHTFRLTLHDVYQ